MTRKITDNIPRLLSHTPLRMPVTIELENKPLITLVRVSYGQYFTLRLYFHEPKVSENMVACSWNISSYHTL